MRLSGVHDAVQWSSREVGRWIEIQHRKDCTRWGASLSRRIHRFHCGRHSTPTRHGRARQRSGLTPSNTRPDAGGATRLDTQQIQHTAKGPLPKGSFYGGILLCTGKGQGRMPYSWLVCRFTPTIRLRHGGEENKALSPGFVNTTCDFHPGTMIVFFTSSFRALASDWADWSRRTEWLTGSWRQGGFALLAPDRCCN